MKTGLGFFAVCLSVLLGLNSVPVRAMEASRAPLAPEFPVQDESAWFNSAPLHLKNLRGQVVLVEFWTFGCGNCLRSIAWVKAVSERYSGQGLRIIGVHTPEFSHERSAQVLAERIKALAIRHPVVQDNDYAYWNAMGNRYWPAFYLIDKQGRVRQAWAGEVRNGGERARQMQSAIERLLAESVK